MIGLSGDPDGPWVQVDLAAQPQVWVVDTVSRRWAAQRLDPDPRRAEVITGSITRIVGALDPAALDAALLLYPVADEPVVTVVGQRSFPAPPGLTLEALGAELCVPEEMLERPRQRSVVETSTVVLASTAFVDLVAAGTWITAVDEWFSGRKHVSGMNG